ncbi:Phosphoglycerate kinase [Gryllus bimaculatus]|nr:Phosphoglycerate kinase [Gryllus bimaculatus]
MELKRKCITDIDVKNKRVVIRADLDIPILGGKVLDNEQIVNALHTIRYALDHQCRSVLLISHVGDADGAKDERFSLRPIADELNKLLAPENRKVHFLGDFHFLDIDRKCICPPKGSILLLENIQFYIEEIGYSKDTNVKAPRDMIMKFRRMLKRYGDVYVNDAFRFCYLTHSSMMGYFFEARVAGLEMQKELKYFHRTLINPRRPFVAIIGGDKFSTKLKILNNLLNVVDEIIVAGGLPFTFLKESRNMKIGDSLYSQLNSNYVRKLMRRAENNEVSLHLPNDFITGNCYDNCTPLKLCLVDDGIPEGNMGLDIAPKSMYHFTHIISGAKTILWHGPVGFIEQEAFGDGTVCIMQAIITATENGATSLVVVD